MAHKIVSFLIVCMTMNIASVVVHAQGAPPTPIHRDEVFKGLQLDIKNKEKAAEALKEKQKKEAENLKSLKGDIVSLGGSIKNAEQALFALEEKISANAIEKSALLKTLLKNQKNLSSGLMAALRMRRVPPETLFLQNTEPLKTAQASMILERNVPQMQRRVSALSMAVERLNIIEQELESQRNEQATKLKNLEGQQGEIEVMISSRQKMITNMRKDYKLAQSAALQLSKEAKSLKDLMEKVRLQNMSAPLPVRRPDRKPSPREESIKTASKPKQTQAPPKTNLQVAPAGLPVSGKILTAYNTPDKFGAQTKGIHIQTRAGGLVTAPLDGTVRFAGDFKNYGQIVIIEHANSLHSMIGGLGKISAIVGQSTKKGEPIGTMPSQNASEGLVLYYELRYKGEPVNPSQKIKELS